MSYPITPIEGLDADEIKSLKAERHPHHGRAAGGGEGLQKAARLLAKKTGIEEKRLLDCANACDHMRIKGMGKGYVGLLRAVGVQTVRELKYRNPAKSRQGHGGGQQEAQAGTLPAVRKARGALGRARQEAAAQDHLSLSRPSVGA